MQRDDEDRARDVELLRHHVQDVLIQELRETLGHLPVPARDLQASHQRDGRTEEELVQHFDLSVHFLGYNKALDTLHWVCLDKGADDQLPGSLNAGNLNRFGSPRDIPYSGRANTGFTGRCFRKGIAFYTEDARFSRASFKGQQVDMPLGIHSALYVPVAVNSPRRMRRSRGVLILTRRNVDVADPEDSTANHRWWEDGTLVTRCPAVGDRVREGGLREVRSPSGDEAPMSLEDRQARTDRNQGIAEVLHEIVAGVRSWESSLQLLCRLLDMHLVSFNSFYRRFDNTVIEAHSAIDHTTRGRTRTYYATINRSLTEASEGGRDAESVVREFLVKRSPTADLLADLETFEPVLGLRRDYRLHFSHMFNVLLLGDVLMNGAGVRLRIAEYLREKLKYILEILDQQDQQDALATFHPEGADTQEMEETTRTFQGMRDSLEQLRERLESGTSTLPEEVWFAVATSHDVAMPVQDFQHWTKRFLETYLPDSRFIPRLDASEYLLHGNFANDISLIYDSFADDQRLKPSFRPFWSRHALVDLALRRLICRSDHGVLSALVTADRVRMIYEAALRREEAGEPQPPDAWPGGEDFHPEFSKLLAKGKYPYFLAPLIATPIALHNLHKWRREALHEPSGAPEQETNSRWGSRDLPKQLRHHSDNEIRGLQVDFQKNPLAFLLTLCDVLQEWGRTQGNGGPEAGELMKVDRIVHTDAGGGGVAVSLKFLPFAHEGHKPTRKVTTGLRTGRHKEGYAKLIEDCVKDVKASPPGPERKAAEARLQLVQKWDELNSFSYAFKSSTTVFIVNFADVKEIEPPHFRFGSKGAAVSALVDALRPGTRSRS